MRSKILCLLGFAICLTLAGTPAFADQDRQKPIIPNLPATPTFSVSTIPSNGDVNPYGVAFVPRGFPSGGLLHPGDILVSNFNNSENIQGTGTTIVRITPSGRQSVFFQGPKVLGLTTALGVLKQGFVLVGNVPTVTTGPAPGTCTTGPNGQEMGVLHGSLLILDRYGNPVINLTDETLLDGPWDLKVVEDGNDAQVFVSNVLSGTVTRIDLKVFKGRIISSIKVRKVTQIASGYLHRCDSAALVVGPTGLAYARDKDILYVASTGDNAIFAVSNARRTNKDLGTGKIVVQDPVHLHGPLGLVRAPNGDLISSQGDAVNPDPNQPSEIVEFNSKGEFVAQFSIDSAPGSAFGMALVTSENGFIFAAVDDGLNVLDVWVVH